MIETDNLFKHCPLPWRYDDFEQKLFDAHDRIIARLPATIGGRYISDIIGNGLVELSNGRVSKQFIIEVQTPWSFKFDMKNTKGDIVAKFHSTRGDTWAEHDVAEALKDFVNRELKPYE